MNRTIKEATVKRFHYDTHDQLRRHLDDFVNAYNFGRRLKTLKGLTPYEAICKTWTAEPKRFTLDPLHQMPGLNNWRRCCPCYYRQSPRLGCPLRPWSLRTRQDIPARRMSRCTMSCSDLMMTLRPPSALCAARYAPSGQNA